jgi:hypothetical protein
LGVGLEIIGAASPGDALFRAKSRQTTTNRLSQPYSLESRPVQIPAHEEAMKVVAADVIGEIEKDRRSHEGASYTA